MPTTTTNYSLYKPLVNDATDEDLWGGYINDSMDLIDTQMKTNADNIALKTTLSAVYPVGSLYINKSVSTNPATLLGFGTWTAVEDKFLVARGSTYTSTGGAATVTLTTNELPAHQHNTTSQLVSPGYGTGTTQNRGDYSSTTSSTTALTSSTGSGAAFSIIPPYQAVYVWERTA